ncbi:hypothetical protein Brms1b_011666 [Colletotrichum noveboracense]|nr:hypothetical protein Brms1b_011666 [Colletotrichum noveboracense]
MKSIFLALAFANQATAAIFPYINITLTPNLTPGNGTKSLSGQLTTDISFKANETVAALPLTIAGQPSAQYDSESLTSAKFWQDDGTKPYKVFIRYNENVGTGGTALYNSFTFGWHDRNKTTTNDTKLLLAHEITHNWPYIYNGNLSDQTRYAEGTAEFYSLRNLWRAGLLITLKYVTAMNTKAIAYYQNPSINLTDQEAVDQSWTVSTAQTVPYGRGLMYLANVDAEREALVLASK